MKRRGDWEEKENRVRERKKRRTEKIERKGERVADSQTKRNIENLKTYRGGRGK